MSKLDEYRREIDKIDEQIIKLLGQRLEAVHGITGVKLASGEDAHQPERASEVLHSRRHLATQNNLDPEVIEAIWRLLIKYFTQLEEEALKN